MHLLQLSDDKAKFTITAKHISAFQFIPTGSSIGSSISKINVLKVEGWQYIGLISFFHKSPLLKWKVIDLFYKLKL